MTCKCHSSTKERKKNPTTQCMACAYKHYVQALSAYNEYGYSDDNRDFVAGELRMLVLHTFKNWQNVAGPARESALAISEGRWDEANMDELGKLIRNNYDQAYPEIRERCDKLQAKGDSE